VDLPDFLELKKWKSRHLRQKMLQKNYTNPFSLLKVHPPNNKLCLLISPKVIEKKMDYLSLSFIVVAVLLLFDGIIFGVAATKGVTSIILVIVGLIIASFIGLAIPVLGAGTGNFIGAMENLLVTAVNRYGPGFFAMPALWIVGFLVGVFAI
jgi:hypothetical protein